MTGPPPGAAAAPRVEAPPLSCPACGGAHLVEEEAGRSLCLDCHSLWRPAEGDGRLVAVGRLCPACGAHNAPGATACAACGGALRPHCLKCGAALAVWRATCPRCGTDQAAYRNQLAAEERERERQQAASASSPAARHRSRRGMWRLVWMIWPLMWVAGALARSARGSARALTASGTHLSLPAQFSQATVALTVGACILGVGVVVLLASALPALLRRD